MKTFRLALIISFAVHGIVLFVLVTGNAKQHDSDLGSQTTYFVSLDAKPQNEIAAETKTPEIESSIADKKKDKEETNSIPNTPAFTGSQSNGNGDADNMDGGLPGSGFNNPAPIYPKKAKHLKQEGVVIVKVLITSEGKAAEVTVRQSSGYPMLDHASIQAVQKWKFKPAKNSYNEVLIPIRFNLKKG